MLNLNWNQLALAIGDQSFAAALTLRLWPGDLRFELGRADFHGRWIDWKTLALGKDQYKSQGDSSRSI